LANGCDTCEVCGIKRWGPGHRNCAWGGPKAWHTYAVGGDAYLHTRPKLLHFLGGCCSQGASGAMVPLCCPGASLPSSTPMSGCPNAALTHDAATHACMMPLPTPVPHCPLACATRPFLLPPHCPHYRPPLDCYTRAAAPNLQTSQPCMPRRCRSWRRPRSGYWRIASSGSKQCRLGDGRATGLTSRRAGGLACGRAPWMLLCSAGACCACLGMRCRLLPGHTSCMASGRLAPVGCHIQLVPEKMPWYLRICWAALFAVQAHGCLPAGQPLGGAVGALQRAHRAAGSAEHGETLHSSTPYRGVRDF
jgi:hypothetical protein